MAKCAIFYLAVFILAYAGVVFSNKLTLAEALENLEFQNLLELIEASDVASRLNASQLHPLSSKSLTDNLVLLGLVNDESYPYQTTTQAMTIDPRLAPIAPIIQISPIAQILPPIIQPQQPAQAASQPQNTFVQNINSNKMSKKPNKEVKFLPAPYQPSYPDSYQPSYSPPYPPNYPDPYQPNYPYNYPSAYPGSYYNPQAIEPQEKERNLLDINALTKLAISQFADASRSADQQPAPGNGYPFNGYGEPSSPYVRPLSASSKPKQSTQSEQQSKKALRLLAALREIKDSLLNTPNPVVKQPVKAQPAKNPNTVKNDQEESSSKKSQLSKLLTNSIKQLNDRKKDNDAEKPKAKSTVAKKDEYIQPSIYNQKNDQKSLINHEEDEETPELSQEELRQLLEP